MNQRAIISVYDEENEVISILYVKRGGKLSVVGREIYDFLKDRKILVDFVSLGKININMGCLCGDIIKSLKNMRGGFYIISKKDFETIEKEIDFSYEIYYNKIIIKNYMGNVIFSGSWDGIGEFTLPDY